MPTPTEGSRSVFMRKGRVKMDLAIVSVAVLLEMEGNTCTKARVAAGAVAPVPKRLHDVEKLLTGTQIDRALCEEAGQLAFAAVTPISDIRASATYRRRLVAVFVKRCVQGAALGGAVGEERGIH